MRNLTRNEVLEYVAKAISQVKKAENPLFEKKEIREDAKLHNDLHLDSMDLADVGVRLEEEFQTDLPGYWDMWPRPETVKDIVDYLDGLNY